MEQRSINPHEIKPTSTPSLVNSTSATVAERPDGVRHDAQGTLTKMKEYLLLSQLMRKSALRKLEPSSNSWQSNASRMRVLVTM